MTQGQKSIVLAVAILAMGGLRLPFELRLTEDLRQAELMPPKLEVRTGERIGQTFSAVSLGGLRTLVATFLNLRAFTFFTQQRWADVESTYEMIVDLAPRTRYYWDTGSWHQAYNAASYYHYENDDLPPLRRKLAWRDSILKGREFLENGIRNNPGDPQMLESLGFLLADPNKIAAFGSPGQAYLDSYRAYQAAVDTGKARGYAKRAALYSLARVPGREADALRMIREIQAEQGELPPTMQGLLFTLEYHQNPDQPVMRLVDSIFPSPRKAYENLGTQWLRSRDRFPVHGIAQAVARLEDQLDVPKEQSILETQLQSPMNPDEAFKQGD